jgi:mRNA interferase MazF
MVRSAEEESLISVVRSLPQEEAGKVLNWARQLADLAGVLSNGPIPGLTRISLKQLRPRCNALKIRNRTAFEARGCRRGGVSRGHVTMSRPAVVLSTGVYHQHRPDVVVGLITTLAPNPLAPTDCALRDWKQAGLRAASYFRLFPVTLPQREVRPIGRLSDSDWASVQVCFKVGLGAE